MKQTEAAKDVGVSSASFSDWESGETKKIEGDNLVNVCELLDISPKWLLFGKGEMKSGSVPVVLTEDDLHAINISRSLGVKERRAWYRTGDTLAEPDGDDGDAPKRAAQ